MKQLHDLMMAYPLTLTHFFERSRRLFAKKTLATRVPGAALFRYTYADFAERTRRLAGALGALPLPPRHPPPRLRGGGGPAGGAPRPPPGGGGGGRTTGPSGPAPRRSGPGPSSRRPTP